VAKDSTTRIKDTLKLIAAYPGAPAYQCFVAAAHTRDEIAAAYPSARNQANLSDQLSQQGNVHAGNEATRAKRRACMLLSTGLGRPGDMARYLALPAGQLDAEALGLIEEAYWAGDKSGTACLDVLNNGLLRDPAGWLGRNELQLRTGAGAGKKIFHMSYDSGSRRFCIGPQAAALVERGCYFEGIQVPAVAWHQWTPGGNDHSLMSGVALEGSPDIMITTQMTGCSLVYKRANDHKVYVAHAYPDNRNADATKRRPGDRLAEELQGQHGATAADFVNAAGGTVEVYGPTGDGIDGYDVGSNLLYIVGIRRGGTWKIYGQHVATADRSLRVFRLYPTPVVRKH